MELEFLRGVEAFNSEVQEEEDDLKQPSYNKSRTMSLEGIGKAIKDIYNDPFTWSAVKNIGFFLIGVKIARECNGMTLMPPTTV